MPNSLSLLLRSFSISAVLLASSLVTAQEKQAVEAIRKTAAEYIDAVNQGDAAKAANFWTENGEYIDEQGRVRKGREMLGERLDANSAPAKRPPLTVRFRSTRFVTDDVAIEDGTSFTAAAGPNEAALARFTVVWVKKGGRWMIDAIHESPLPSLSNYEKLHGLSPLLGEWVHQSGDASVHLSAHWSEGNNYLRREFSIKSNGEQALSGTQYIGYDPNARQIRSWTFDSDGGHTVGTWTRDGDAWVVHSEGYMRNGHRTTSTNIYTVNDGQMTRRSVDSRVNDQPIPDSEIVLTLVPDEE